MPHRRRNSDQNQEETIPRISMDYFYMSRQDEEAKENHMLVILNKQTIERYARATGRKGVGTEGLMDWLVKDICEELKTWGHAGGPGGHIILKSDNERAMAALRHAIAKFHGGVVVQESPAKGESQSNGAVEGAGRIVREFVRVFKIQIEEKAKIEIESTDAILQWIIRWAAMVCSRYLVGTDGKTGWERRRGRPCNMHAIPFGEKVWYKEVREGKAWKKHLDSEEREGIWLGHARSSNEVLIWNGHKIARAYTIKRQSPISRWDGAMIKEMKGTPRQPDPDKNGEAIQIQVNFDSDATEAPLEVKENKMEVRRMRITAAMLAKYGYTEGCEGCRYKRAGLAEAKAHSERCRQRIVEAMSEMEEGRRVMEREDERHKSQWLDAMVTDFIIPESTTELTKVLNKICVDIAEAYSPPRVTNTAHKLGMTMGYVLDLTTGWDFTAAAHREAAREYVRLTRPELIIGSPVCTMSSSLQRLSKFERREDWFDRFEEAKSHIKFVVSLYEQQWREGRMFVHERPAGATSWDLEEMREFERKTGVCISTANHCIHRLETRREDGMVVKAAKNASKFMTNSNEIDSELQRKCDANPVHQELAGGEAQWSARYPEELCKAICRGVVKELRNQTDNVKFLFSITAMDRIELYSNVATDDGRQRGFDHEDGAAAWDDVTGESLDPSEVLKARALEIEYCRDKSVWIKITRAEAQRRGIKIIKTRWLDINKGDRWHPNYRSRFVGKEFNDQKGGEPGWFAATPPLEALKLLISDAATVTRNGTKKAMMFNDVARAYFEAPVKRKICIELPKEDWTQEDGNQDLVGLLQKSLYGTRDAASNFQAEIKSFMQNIGFRCGRYNPCTYWHPKKGLKTMTHGDDFASSGFDKDLEWLREEMAKRFQIKTQMIGHNYAKEGKILNRIVRVTKEGWEYEADQRHGEVIVESLKLTEANEVSSPGEDAKPWEEEEDAQKLDESMAKGYRTLGARANYLAMDRPDIQFATKEICRGMANPTRGDKKKLKRLARYLIGRPRLVSKFRYQEEPWEVDGFSDSDWAGCKRTAKSTSGGVIMCGAHCIKSWSATQKNITLSSGEAELVACVKMSAELLGIVQLMADWGSDRTARVYVDSTAAIAVTQRKGNGKLRHVKVGMLWIQEKVEDGELAVNKILGTENPADVLTKNLSGKKIEAIMERINQEARCGRADLSLRN